MSILDACGACPEGNALTCLFVVPCERLQTSHSHVQAVPPQQPLLDTAKFQTNRAASGCIVAIVALSTFVLTNIRMHSA